VLRVQVDEAHRLVCVHEPPLGEGDGPQLALDAVSMEALLRASVAAASLQQLGSVQAALRAEPALAAPPATVLRRGATPDDAPSLVLPFQAAGAAPPSMRCDWRTGALRLVGAVPLLSAAAVRELEEYTQRASAAAAASRMVAELWRRSVCSEVAQLARSLGMRPLASPKCALRYAGGAPPPDVLLQLPPAGAALHLAIYLDGAAPTAQHAKLVWFAGRPGAATLPAPADHLQLLAADAATAAGGWEAMLRGVAEWGSVHSARIAAEAQLAALSANFAVLAAPGEPAQLLLDANGVAPGVDSGVRLRFGAAHEAAWSALLPDASCAPPAGECSGAAHCVPLGGTRLRYAHAEEHLGGGVPALFRDIRAVRACPRRVCGPPLTRPLACAGGGGDRGAALNRGAR
jgi:hypothetical protein